MAKVKVYDGYGQFHEVEPEAVHLYTDRGFTRTPPEEPLQPGDVKEVTPSLGLSPLDNQQLLHVAAIANLEVPGDADRQSLEELLQSAWNGLGQPEGWLENALAAPAPIAPEEFEAPSVHGEAEEPVAAEEFEAGITETE